MNLQVEERKSRVTMRGFPLSILTVMLVALASLANGGNLEEGLKAAEAGDAQKAHRLWLIEAEQGNAKAQRYLGVLYGRGQGVVQNDREAARWFHLAAEQRDSIAQSNLGVLYARGQGVKQSDQEAAKWFHKAALQGDAKAQFWLGVMYEIGRGVAKNPVVASSWYLLARENGVGKAENSLDSLWRKMTADEIAMSRQIAEQTRSQTGR